MRVPFFRFSACCATRRLPPPHLEQLGAKVVAVVHAHEVVHKLLQRHGTVVVLGWGRSREETESSAPQAAARPAALRRTHQRVKVSVEQENGRGQDADGVGAAVVPVLVHVALGKS